MTIEPDETKIERPVRPSRRYEPEYEDTPPSKKTANPLLLLAVAVALSVLVSVMWVNNAGFASGDDFNALTDSIDKSQSNITASISSIPNVVTTQINAVLGNVNNQVSNVQNAVNDLRSQVGTYSGQINNMVASVASLNSEMDSLTKANSSLDAKITALEAKITELETPASGSDGSPITVTKIQIINEDFDYDETTDITTVTFAVKVYLENNVDEDLEDIELEILMYIDADDDILEWRETSSNWRLADLYSYYGGTSMEAILIGNRIRLDGGGTRKIICSMTVKIEGEHYNMGVDADEDDAEITDWGYE